MTPRPASPSERAEVVGFLFAHLGAGAVADKLQQISGLMNEGVLDTQALWRLDDGHGLAGAILAAPIAGGGAIVWPPRVRPSHHAISAVEDALVRAVQDWLRSRGAVLAQTLLPLDEAESGRPLERGGFVRMTTLIIEQHFLDLEVRDFATAGRLTFRTVDTVASHVLESTLERTYQGSLDCPELNGRRPARDVLLGHRGGGPFDPGRWWVAAEGDEPVGLVLCNLVEANTWDIAYLGVVPEARQRGHGRALLTHALLEAKAAGMLMASITVDARNTPARQLYHRAGFTPVDEKVVWLWWA